MISVTPKAAEQIRSSAQQGGTDNMPLRIAVTIVENGGFHYAMGFDDNKHEGDQAFQSCWPRVSSVRWFTSYS